MELQTKANSVMSDEKIVDLYWQRDEQAIKETDIKYKKFLLSVAMNIVHDMCDTLYRDNDSFVLYNSLVTESYDTIITDIEPASLTRQETDANGNVVEVIEEINTVYVTVITTPKSVTQIAEEYGFTAQQKQMLTELLSSENAELWAGILSE